MPNNAMTDPLKALRDKIRSQLTTEKRPEPGQPRAAPQPPAEEWKLQRYIFLVHETQCECGNTWLSPSGLFLDKSNKQTKASKWEAVPSGATVQNNLPKVTVLHHTKGYARICMRCRDAKGFPKVTVNG